MLMLTNCFKIIRAEYKRLGPKISNEWMSNAEWIWFFGVLELQQSEGKSERKI